MKEVFSISKKLWQLVVCIFTLLFRLSRQVVLPNRKRKGNLLNSLFLFYIGTIENIQHFEHKRFKMAQLFQNRLLRKGLMLFSFLLFLLTSFEQAAGFQRCFNEFSKIESAYQNAAHKLSYSTSKDIPVKFVSALDDVTEPRHNNYAEPRYNGSKSYLRNLRMLI